jgi:hypothetical protein
MGRSILWINGIPSNSPRARAIVWMNGSPLEAVLSIVPAAVKCRRSCAREYGLHHESSFMACV